MDIEKFKKESDVTYVHVSGRPSKLYYDSGNKPIKFHGFIQVPFRFEDFTAFDEYQQKAICEASLNKAGLPIQVNFCDLRFYQVNDIKEDDVDED